MESFMFEEDYELNRKKFIHQLRTNPKNRKQFCGGWMIDVSGAMCAIPVGLEAFYPIKTLESFTNSEERADVFYDLFRYKLEKDPEEVYKLNDANMSFEKIADKLERNWL